MTHGHSPQHLRMDQQFPEVNHWQIQFTRRKRDRACATGKRNPVAERRLLDRPDENKLNDRTKASHTRRRGWPIIFGKRLHPDRH